MADAPLPLTDQELEGFWKDHGRLVGGECMFCRLHATLALYRRERDEAREQARDAERRVRQVVRLHGN